MRAAALLPFVPSGLLIPFYMLGGLGVGFLFDEPISGALDGFLRYSIAICVYSYPLVWATALVLTVIALFRDWSSKTLVKLAVAPFIFGGAPFIFFDLLGRSR